MPRRRHESGATAESDSFLDIVANIVGILIILIVVAGVRVSQAPTAAPTVIEIEEPRIPAATVRAPVVAPRPTIVKLPRPEAPPPPEVSPELLASIETITNDISAHENVAQHLQREADRYTHELAVVENESKATAISLAAAEADIEGVELADQQLAREIDELQSALDGIGRQISNVPSEKVTVLRHRLNPIGREVREKELHFRIAGGRVARVPIEELVERVKPQIERQKDWIAKYQRQLGSVGPVDGFTMEYVVERQRLNPLEELRAGAQMMRITVTGWKVVPEHDLMGETADAALHSESKFMSALRLADPRATLTFWVYPDSFQTYRRLQKVAHDEGFSVAARPLPQGVPIAGSPSGSRSSSQ